MKLFERGELRLLWPFYLEGFVTLVLFFMPAFYVIYFKHIGLSLFQTGLVWAMAPLFSLLTDIPTGAIADLYGRKFSVLVGTVLQGICFLLVFITTDFYALLAIFAVLGMAMTFVSGAYEAWMTELIRKHDKKLLHSFFTKKASIDSAGLLLGGIVGAIVVKMLGITIIWPVAAAAFFTGFVILLFAKEHFTPKRTRVGESVRRFRAQVRSSLSFSFRHHVIVHFLAASVLLSIGSSFLTWAPFIQGFDVPNHVFGYIWSGFGLLGILGPLVAAKFYKKGKERMVIVIAIAGMVLASLAVIAIYNAALAVAALFTLVFFDSAKRPTERVYFHAFIPDKMRATIGSIESMLISLAVAIGMPITGLAVDTFGARTTIVASGMLMLVALWLYRKVRKS